jgi:hypothetical protein
MTQELNQFSQSTEKGILDMSANPNVLNVKIDSSSVNTLTGGSVVVYTDTAGKVITVDKASAISDDIAGVVLYEVKKNSFVADDFVRIAFANSVVIMEASSAIAKGADVEAVLTGDKVATQSTGTTIGRALDKASADGDLIRVLIKVN